MDSIYIENFRCFKKGREVPLAPLTLLVGENGTGKTSFMAMIQALWNMASRREIPDFNEAPYELGNFDDIAYHDRKERERASKIVAGFSINNEDPRHSFTFRTAFGERDGIPTPIELNVSNKKSWYKAEFVVNSGWDVNFGTKNGSWATELGRASIPEPVAGSRFLSQAFLYRILPRHTGYRITERENQSRKDKGTLPNEGDISKINDLLFGLNNKSKYHPRQYYSMGPIRAKAKRSYIPLSTIEDSEGENMPSYLESVCRNDRDKWSSLQCALEAYGRESYLFDRISIHPHKRDKSDPFQIMVRGNDSEERAQWQNLVDAGYGISQVLPIVVNIGSHSQATYLLQQPEAYLHPRAQAALGTFFFDIAARKKTQIIAETHGEYLIDRVRMKIREESDAVNPEAVSILYFEKSAKDVHIHPIGVDRLGNVDAPKSYGRFGMDEIRRSLGL